MKPNFLREMLSSGVTNRISSKRGAMIWFVLLFTGTVVVGLVSGRYLEHDTKFQLFELTAGSMVLVYGEKLMGAIQALRGQKTTADMSPDPPIIKETNSK